MRDRQRKEGDRDRETQRETETDRQTETRRETEREKKKNRKRERQRERETDGRTARQRDREERLFPKNRFDEINSPVNLNTITKARVHYLVVIFQCPSVCTVVSGSFVDVDGQIAPVSCNI